jgi:hypothetical protein
MLFLWVAWRAASALIALDVSAETELNGLGIVAMIVAVCGVVWFWVLVVQRVVSIDWKMSPLDASSPVQRNGAPLAGAPLHDTNVTRDDDHDT